MGYCCPVRTKGTADDHAFRQGRDVYVTGTKESQRAFAVLAVEPWGGCVAADRIKALCAGIPGVGALRVDADRGRIHVLYDGTAAAIAQVENAVRIPGHSIRLLGNRPLAQPQALVAEGCA